MSDENISEKSIILSEDLIVYILKRVPVKCVLRCMVVCKSWYTLIKTTHFIATHLSHQIHLTNTVGPRGMLYWDMPDTHMSRVYFVHSDNPTFDRTHELILPEEDDHDVVIRAGICDGIVCLGHNVRPIVVLWNPSLRKKMRLNIPHVGKGGSFLHGVGFDLASGDYKVVSIVQPSWSRNAKKTILQGVYVYSLREGTWKVVDGNVSLVGNCSIHFIGKPVNGVLHWLVDEGCPAVPVTILTFNLADETIGEIPLPEGVETNPNYYEYAKLMIVPGNGIDEEDRLGYLQIDCGREMSLWVMETYGVAESWKLVFSMEGRRNGYKGIVNVKKNGELIMEREDGRLASLDPKNMSSRVVWDDQKIDYLGTYMESLLLL